MNKLLKRFPFSGWNLLNQDSSRSDQIADAIAEQTKIVGHYIKPRTVSQNRRQL